MQYTVRYQEAMFNAQRFFNIGLAPFKGKLKFEKLSLSSFKEKLIEEEPGPGATQNEADNLRDCPVYCCLSKGDQGVYKLNWQ